MAQFFARVIGHPEVKRAASHMLVGLVMGIVTSLISKD